MCFVLLSREISVDENAGGHRICLFGMKRLIYPIDVNPMEHVWDILWSSAWPKPPLTIRTAALADECESVRLNLWDHFINSRPS
ncbi:hypothetical protein HNY73_010043 [Argiope bruennichi]|uniref:Uncharacterized protein n=1 Tax=Argiope bruennichi TaxID=94029 RepID=A0A8T0F1Z3_ARGBR|nr:hypothetical protein HNY73_010043 [Argiope bruennichi]